MLYYKRIIYCLYFKDNYFHLISSGDAYATLKGAMSTDIWDYNEEVAKMSLTFLNDSDQEIEILY